MTSPSPDDSRYDRNRRMELSRRPVAQQSDAIHLAMHQVPALRSAPVGGDWCDAFVQAEGQLLVIGDVAGHDAKAARAMIRLRHLLRRIAAGTAPGAGPAELLTAVDRAMTSHGVDILTTGIVARLNRLPDSSAWRLRWSNAGHPPPMLLDADGRISTLETRPDRPLGIGAHCSRSETDVVLHTGSTLVLFTDGLIERRGQVIDDGIRLLAATLTELGPPTRRGPEVLRDELLTRLLPPYPEDDVSLLVVHLTTPTALHIGRPSTTIAVTSG